MKSKAPLPGRTCSTPAPIALPTGAWAPPSCSSWGARWVSPSQEVSSSTRTNSLGSYYPRPWWLKHDQIVSLLWPQHRAQGRCFLNTIIKFHIHRLQIFFFPGSLRTTEKPEESSSMFLPLWLNSHCFLGDFIYFLFYFTSWKKEKNVITIQWGNNNS